MKMKIKNNNAVYFRRLRQRMYVFVISLVASNVVLGLAFLSDVIMKFIYYRNQDAGNSEQDCHIKARDWLIVTESKCVESIHFLLHFHNVVC